MNIFYFPAGIATGQAFFNRKQELLRLQKNIEKGRHTLLMSPRRYGKSSLAKQAIHRHHLAYAEIDLFVTLNDKSVEDAIISGVKQIIKAVSDKPTQWLKTLVEFFTRLDKRWTIGLSGLEIELKPEKRDPINNILDSLYAVEHVLKKKDQKAVFFVDEFQEISHLEQAKGIEGAIRHFAQESTYLVFVFSGSNRHLLANMFDDSTRPLYLLCDRIKLERISAADYTQHLQVIAQKTWKAPLQESTLQTIFRLAERHSYYMNLLCERVWDTNPQELPTASSVESCWKDVVLEKRTEMRKEMSELSTGQLKILVAIALGNAKSLTGKVMQQKLNLSGATLVQALQILTERDYIEYTEEEPHTANLVDPLLKSSLQYYYKDFL